MQHLPKEIWINILEYLSAKDLARLGSTSKALTQLTADDGLWHRLALAEWGINSKEHLCVFTFYNAKQFYCEVLLKYGRMIGLWQSNYPFFSGRLLQIRFQRTNPVIIGELLTCSNVAEPVSAELHGVLGVSMDELVPSIVRRRTFEVRFEPADQAAQSQRDLSNTCLANEEAEMVDRDPGRGITSYSVCFGVEGSRPDTLGQGHLATPVCDNAEFYEQWTCNVPFPKFKPAPGTGLWSYLDGSRVLGGTGTLITMVNGNAEEPPLAFSPVMEGGDIPADDAERSPVLVLACDLSCYEYSTRTIALRQPPDPFQFTSKKLNTLWSKVRLESDVSGGQLRIRPKEGLWVGTYGGHGVEFLLARYDAMGALLQFYKLTGDVNVPRGEVSLQVLLLEELEESIAPWVVSSPGMATMYAGFGTVATVGYRHPTKIDSQVIFISEREVAVYWQDLRKVSRYIKVDL